MIKETHPLSMAEAAEYIKTKNEDVNMAAFIKKFTSLKPAQAKELRENIKALDLLKVSDKHISKIIDILPETKEDLNKIFTDVGLDEDETNKLLDEVKKIK